GGARAGPAAPAVAARGRLFPAIPVRRSTPPLLRRPGARAPQHDSAAARLGRPPPPPPGGAMTETTRPDARPADGATSDGERWLAEARAAVGQDPASVSRAFALAGRKVGRAPLRPDVDPAGIVHGTVDDAARAALVVALADAL